VSVTHEPERPLPGWPESHARAESVFGEPSAECIKITVHGVTHYLHGTTAAALATQLHDALEVSDSESAAVAAAATPEIMAQSMAEVHRRLWSDDDPGAS